jgi:hypothetical protein
MEGAAARNVAHNHAARPILYAAIEQASKAGSGPAEKTRFDATTLHAVPNENMGPIDLRADCSKCAALCCTALAFDRSALFAFDKQAGEPCRHLVGRSCAIHAQRAAQGMQGCINYDCLGAGQRATELQSTRIDVLDAFALFRDVHQLSWLLRTCRERLALSELQREELSRLEAQLLEVDDSPGLERFAQGTLSAEARRFVATLRGATLACDSSHGHAAPASVRTRPQDAPPRRPLDTVRSS